MEIPILALKGDNMRKLAQMINNSLQEKYESGRDRVKNYITNLGIPTVLNNSKKVLNTVTPYTEKPYKEDINGNDVEAFGKSDYASLHRNRNKPRDPNTLDRARKIFANRDDLNEVQRNSLIDAYTPRENKPTIAQQPIFTTVQRPSIPASTSKPVTAPPKGPSAWDAGNETYENTKKYVDWVGKPRTIEKHYKLRNGISNQKNLTQSQKNELIRALDINRQKQTGATDYRLQANDIENDMKQDRSRSNELWKQTLSNPYMDSGTKDRLHGIQRTNLENDIMEAKRNRQLGNNDISRINELWGQVLSNPYMSDSEKNRLKRMFD